MMIKDKTFWVGVLVGYLLLVFVPQLNFRSHMTKGNG
jgi:hypothetical protein